MKYYLPKILGMILILLGGYIKLFSANPNETVALICFIGAVVVIGLGAATDRGEFKDRVEKRKQRNYEERKMLEQQKNKATRKYKDKQK